MRTPENAVTANGRIPEEVLVYVDESAGSGAMAYGFVVKVCGETVARESGAFSIPYYMPPSFATCRGILAALRWLLDHEVCGSRVRVVSDNSIAYSLPKPRGPFRWTRKSISEAAGEIGRRARALGADCEVTFERVPRALMAGEADRLARAACRQMNNPTEKLDLKKLEVV